MRRFGHMERSCEGKKIAVDDSKGQTEEKSSRKRTCWLKG